MLLFFGAGCGQQSETKKTMEKNIAAQGTYAYDADFLKQYQKGFRVA